MKHGTVRSPASAKVMALMETGKSPPFGNANHIHALIGLKLVDQNLIAHFDFFLTRIQPNFSQQASRIRSRTLEMPFKGLRHSLGSRKFDQSQLNRIVTILAGALLLHDDAGPCFQNGSGHDVTVLLENLCHTQLFAKNAVYHNAMSVACGLSYIFTATGKRTARSTPRDDACPLLRVLFSEGLNLNIHAGRKVKLCQGVDRRASGFQNVHQALVGADFKLLT